MRKAVFLDRDGTINEDHGYVYKPEDFTFLPHAITGMKKMQELGYLLIIVTNQSGIGRGYYSEQDFMKLQKHMLSLLSKKGITITKTYHCPHGPEAGCGCRKPKPLMIRQAEKRFTIDLTKSFAIGDKTADIMTGKNASCTTILVRTGKAGKDGKYDIQPDFTAKDLDEAAAIIQGQDSSKKALMKKPQRQKTKKTKNIQKGGIR